MLGRREASGLSFRISVKGLFMRTAVRAALVLLAAALVGGLFWELLSSSPSNNSVHKPAPATQGTDADGAPMRLSDSLGKVVMLDFWGNWCPHCREMYASDRSLVEHYQDRPFVLLGVNTDDDAATSKQVQEKLRLPWRSWYDGVDGPICREWRVRGLPYDSSSSTPKAWSVISTKGRPARGNLRAKSKRF